jgi:thiol:disulfide interchange protein DsbD
MSLFGVFELILPSSLLTKVTGSTSKAGSTIAPLLMGLTFALTSFTCTVPIVGSLLAGAATGDRIYPALGMIGFSLALALPFLLLAMFPTLLKKLPRSGSWMVTAKSFMGFLELVAALKFLSNIDLVLKLGILTKPVFLAIWASLFVIAGIHLLGWIKLPHDSPGKIGVVRKLFALASLASAVFCLAAINGASLGPVSGLLPPTNYPGRSGSSLDHQRLSEGSRRLKGDRQTAADRLYGLHVNQLSRYGGERVSPSRNSGRT